ncbi:MAG: hypothetical protein KF687_06175 [Cyclobacteriaceae bacterium]|nr:hypothetical protein [Cyclobacteriaceae bacterium]
MRWWLYFSSLIFLFLHNRSAISQTLPEQLIFEQVYVPGTIRSSEIVDILQDPEGLIWIAADGLFQFDGLNFIRFTILPDSGSIAGREINSLFYDNKQKRLLIATRNNGVVEYNYNTNGLRKLPARDGIPIVNELAQTPDGLVWATSFINGLFYIENDTLRKFANPNVNTNTATSLIVYNDQLLVGDLRKVFFLKEKKVVDSLYLSWPNTEFTVYGRITAMEIDGNNKLYLGTEKQGAIIYDLNTKRFTKYFSPDTNPFYNRINDIFVDRNQLVWILTKAGGLTVYSSTDDRFLPAVRNPLSSSSLSGDNCTSIFEDKTGIIWVGATGAINKYDPTKIKFQHITNDPLNTNSLSDKMVRGIYEADNGDLLIGTDGGFVNQINRKSNAVIRHRIKLPGVEKPCVPMYFHDLDINTILIASSVGVVAMDKRNYTFSWYKPLQAEFVNKMTRQILQLDQKLYILASGALFVFDLTTKQITKFSNFSSDPQKRAINATALYIDSKKRIWIGAQGGVSLVNDDLTFTYYPIEKNPVRPDGSYFMVLSIHEVDNNLWIGTFSSGLWQLDMEQLNAPEEAIKRIDIPEINTNTIYATIPDEENNVWISTNQGILKFEPGSKTVTQFAVSEGVQDLEFNRLAYLKTRQHEIVFGGINGLNIFNPEKITTSYALVKPVILNAYGLKDTKHAFHINLRQAASLKLTHNQNQVSFSILVPNYQQPPTYLTEYRLEEHDAHWNISQSNTITYNNLKPGKYTFRIRTKFRGEVTESDTIDIEIAYPFWLTWWFIAISIVAVGLVTYSGIKAYAAKTRHDKERLEKLLRERTAEIEKSREELEILNEKKDLIFSILSHDLRSPLTTLKGFLSIIIENVDALPKEAIKKHARSIRNSVSSSLDLIDNTLYWSMSQTGSIAYTPANFSITDALRKIYNLYLLTAEKKRIHFHFSVAENIEVYGDENMLYVALRNLVSNALKFTSEGKNVHISASRNHHNAIIKIADEGIGMDSNYIQKLMADEQLSLKIGTANEKGTGLGLILCKKFVQLNQGELNIVSVESTGTEFTVSLPLAT